MIVPLRAIDHTIRQLCVEVRNLSNKSLNWKTLPEETLFYKVAVCIFSSQMLYEDALAMANHIKRRGMLQVLSIVDDFEQYGENLKMLLSEPIERSKRGSKRIIFPRFKNRLSKLLSETAQNIYGKGKTVKSLLASAKDARHARALLILYVSGFGPKQASLFLRIIGFCSELAILDTHILAYLKLVHGLEIKPSMLSSLKWYENIETKFRRISEDFGYDVGCVDLAMWITMRVAKREYTI